MALDQKKNKLTLKSLEARIDGLETLLNETLTQLSKRKERGSRRQLERSGINKIETYNGELEPEAKKETSLKMNYDDKLVSLKNATMILPPNLKVDGRHTARNCSAICGFEVTEEMLDEVYED